MITFTITNTASVADVLVAYLTTSKFVSIPTVGTEFRSYIHAVSVLPSEEECMVQCYLDATGTCGYLVFDDTTTECFEGNLDNVATVAPLGNEANTAWLLACTHDIYVCEKGNVKYMLFFPAFDRPATLVSHNYFSLSDPNNPYDDDVWPKLIHASIAEAGLTAHICESYCLLHAGPCQFFYLPPASDVCYLGTFMFETDGGFIGPMPDGAVNIRNGIYGTLSPAFRTARRDA